MPKRRPPATAPTHLVGRLIGVHLTKRQCSLRTPARGTWECRFPSSLKLAMQQALGTVVSLEVHHTKTARADGTVLVAALVPIIPRDDAEDVADHATISGRELVAELRRMGLIGAWGTRQDLPDSPVFARELREESCRPRRDI